MLDQVLFVRELERLAAVFGITLTEPRIDAYYDTLADKMTDAAFIQVCRECREAERFFPVPVVLIERARAYIQQEYSASAQWEVVLKAAETYNPYRPVQPTLDAETHYALKVIGGLRYLAAQETKALPFIRKEFMAVYEQRCQRSVAQRVADFPRLGDGGFAVGPGMEVIDGRLSDRGASSGS